MSTFLQKIAELAPDLEVRVRVIAHLAGDQRGVAGEAYRRIGQALGVVAAELANDLKGARDSADQARRSQAMMHEALKAAQAHAAEVAVARDALIAEHGPWRERLIGFPRSIGEMQPIAKADLPQRFSHDVGAGRCSRVEAVNSAREYPVLERAVSASQSHFPACASGPDSAS